LITKMKFTDLKFQNAKLMEHIFTNKIWVHYNQSETLQVSALGFIQGVHPRVTHRDGYLVALQDAIHLEMTEIERTNIKKLLPPGKKKEPQDGESANPDIKLEVISRTVGYGNGDSRVKTEAFEIRVPLEIRVEIKEIITRLGIKHLIPKGVFIPYGLVQTVGAEVYKTMLRRQNEYLLNFRIVPVFGITPQALANEIAFEQNDGNEVQMTLQNYILSQEGVKGVETTNRAADLGKLFILSDTAGINSARAFVDNTIKELYESGTISPDFIHKDFNPPRRGDAPRISASTQSYATALAAWGNPQDDATPGGSIAPPPRPAKRNVNMVYDLAGTSDFPTLPKRKNQTKKNQTADTSTQNQTNDNSNTQSSNTGQAVTQDALSQLREEMKREFTELIQTEVRKQIETEMAKMQQEMANIGVKIDSIKTSIKDSIGEAIRAGIKESMGQQPTQPRQYFRHELGPDIGLQPPATNQSNNPKPAATQPDSASQQMQTQENPQQENTQDPTNVQDPHNNQDAATHHSSGTCPKSTGAQE
jgi:hypothetical protein